MSEFKFTEIVRIHWYIIAQFLDEFDVCYFNKCSKRIRKQFGFLQKVVHIWDPNTDELIDCFNNRAYRWCISQINQFKSVPPTVKFLSIKAFKKEFDKLSLPDNLEFIVLSTSDYYNNHPDRISKFKAKKLIHIVGNWNKDLCYVNIPTFTYSDSIRSLTVSYVKQIGQHDKMTKLNRLKIRKYYGEEILFPHLRSFLVGAIFLGDIVFPGIRHIYINKLNQFNKTVGFTQGTQEIILGALGYLSYVCPSLSFISITLPLGLKYFTFTINEDVEKNNVKPLEKGQLTFDLVSLYVHCLEGKSHSIMEGLTIIVYTGPDRSQRFNYH